MSDGQSVSSGVRSPAGRELPRASELARHWSHDPGVVFLNHGSFGGCPRVVLERQREVQDLIEREPVRFFVELCEPLLDRARGVLAAFLGCDGEGLAFVPNATAGVNTVLASLDLQAGDELLTNAHEYNACNNALAVWGARRGARVVSVSPGLPVRSAGEVTDAVLAGVTRRTKLALISHVTSPTGLVFPVAEMTGALQARGVQVLIDGAHAPGMVALSLKSINADYYTGNLHKWLCTPKGCAFVHVREDRREGIRPLVISHGANATRAERSRFRVEFDYVGTYDVSAYLCIERAIAFLSALVPGGMAGLMAHNRTNAIEARRILNEALEQEPISPESMLGSLASVHLPDPAGGVIRPSLRGYHDRLSDALIERHAIQAPVMPFPPREPGVTYGPDRPQHRMLRVAMQGYNTLKQVRYLAECVQEELRRERAGGSSA